MVQSFGASLLSALEKKDVEELTLLRSVHERELRAAHARDARPTRCARRKLQLQSVVEAKVNVENRISYYAGSSRPG